MLEDAFALLAYPNPWESPVGWQLSPNEREFVSAALNSTLLEAGGYPPRPPLEVKLSNVFRGQKSKCCFIILGWVISCQAVGQVDG